MKYKFTFGIIILILGSLIIITLSAATGEVDNGSYRSKQVNLVMRGIGHDLLLASGDATSRVMPVKQLNDLIFEIAFEKPFSFMTDTLARIVEKRLDDAGIKDHHMVNVVSCSVPSQIIYGYDYQFKNDAALACSGRIQEKGCYRIQVIFPEAKQGGDQIIYASLAGVSFVAVALLIGVPFSRRKQLQKPEALDFITVGNFKFSNSQQILNLQNDIIELSDKESKLLQILSSTPNELVSRDRLMKEIWEDEGVFVGRSLDVFVSKLRKKLQGDESVKIISVHGKGYKMVW